MCCQYNLQALCSYDCLTVDDPKTIDGAEEGGGRGDGEEGADEMVQKRDYDSLKGMYSMTALM